MISQTFLRNIFLAVIIMSSLNARGQVTALECLRNFYISANTLPQYIVERQFTGIRTTAGTRVTYLTSPVTNTVSGFFVTLRGNNGATVTVDSRNTTPSFAAATPLIAWISACNSSNTNVGGVTAIEEITYGGVMPVYIPSSTTARHFVTEQGQEWYFSAFIWFFNGVIRQTTPPPFQTIISGITYNYGEALWYNTSNNTYNKYYTSCSCWKEIPNIDRILSDTGIVKTTTAQTIWGAKEFKNTITASEGIITQGKADKAANTINGVVKGKRRLITANTTLDGSDFYLEVSHTTADIEIILPAITAETAGWKWDIVRNDDTNYKTNFKRPDNTFIRLLNKTSVTLRNNGINWFFD